MIWDLVIITARTAQQRWLFERYLEQLWPTSAPARMVLQDPPGPQLGTGGATVHALCTAAQRLGARLAEARILLLHCGGFSQRVPQLAHVGKAFAPGAGGEEVTLFAQVVGELNALFREMEPGVVVACGDVYYSAPHLHTAFRREEAVALAYRAPAEQAARHGVYLWETEAGLLADSRQKPSATELCALDTAQPWGLDTGVLYLGSEIVAHLLQSVGAAEPVDLPTAFLRRRRAWSGVELYRDLTPPMARSWRPERRLAGAPGDAQQALARYSLRVVCPEKAQFLHFGTNRELLAILAAGGIPRIYASYIANGDLGPGVVLDRCLAEQPIQVGSGSYVSGLNRPGREVTVGPAQVVYQLPLRASAGRRGLDTCVVLGTGDDARRRPEEGATLLGEPTAAILRELGVSAEEVWEGIPERERCLWNARLFPVAEAAVVAEAMPWVSGLADTRFGERVDQWRRYPRISPAEANRLFDARRWWRHEQRIRDCRFAAVLEETVRNGESAILGQLLETANSSEAARRRACRKLRALGAAQPASLTGARAWLAASALASPETGEPLRERGFRALRRALVPDHAVGGRAPAWQLAPGQGVAAHAPVRVDLAGGWTDTPPQACERGGTVLNIALLLDGQRPITARVERLAEPIVELIASDLGAGTMLRVNPSPQSRLDPRDPFGIHCAGLRLLGLFTETPLRDRLRLLGGGLRLTTEAAVPKGSGLGTSSILGAALLAALYAAFGITLSPDDLCLEVLRLEQVMGTGGGWQDQVGGLWGGVKFATSAPGLEQRPQVEKVDLAPRVEEELAERMVVFYTGEPRLAKDILQRVVGGYLVGRPEMMAALAEMPGLAARARAALQSGDWDTLGSCLNRSWELNRQLEPTSSNEGLDALLAQIAPFVTGAKLSGAGGGGFLFALARDRRAREDLCARLASLPPPARLYSPALDRSGLQIVHD